MAANADDKTGNQKETDKIKAQTQAQMIRARLNDYIAIVLALGAVFILWILQLLGLY